jgi:molybdate transport system ATP-binding protein
MSIRGAFTLDLPTFRLEAELDLPGRGVTALFGPSGSGKTTLLRCIAGLERPLGRLEVQGEVWQGGGRFLPPHRRAVGYIFQEANLFPHLSVRDNLDYGMRRASPEPGGGLGGFDSVVALLGLETLLPRRPDRLSGGERQRVAIARALLTAPRLLLMDEPLASLDLARKKEILPYLERLHAELDIPVLYVSHAADEVARLADHLVLMEGGRTTLQGPLTELLSRVDLPLRLGEEVGAIFEGTVAERDSHWHLARIDFDGGQLWVRDGGAAVGHRVRVRILARDVSIAASHHADVSILNLLPATVTALAGEDDPALALVQLQVGATTLLARLTCRSVDRLDLAPGRPVWAQIKAVALID